MSNFDECIVNGLAEGEITAAQAARAQDLYQGYLEEFEKTIPFIEAKRKAAGVTFKTLEAEAFEVKRRARLTQKVAQQNVKNMREYRDIFGNKNMGAAMTAHIEYDQVGKFSTLDGREKAVWGQLHSVMDEAIVKFRRGYRPGGQPEKATLQDMVREAFGEDTGSATAKMLAQGWKSASEMARKRLNAAGGAIGRIEDWGLPTTHNAAVIRRIPYERWRDEMIMPHIDPSKMIDDLTGEAFSPARLELALKDMYEAIKSDNWSRLDPSMRPKGNGGPARKHNHERFLMWKSADDWMRYQELAGQENAFEAMTDHLRSMAKDIAALEILGPNPRAMLTFMAETARKDAALSPLKSKKTLSGKEKLAEVNPEREIKRAEDMFAIWNGDTNIPVNNFAHNFMGSIRSFLTSVKLGSSFLTGLTDAGYQSVARNFNGLPVSRTMRDSFKLMNPRNVEDQKLAIRNALIAEHATAKGLAQARFTGEVAGSAWSRWLADSVLRASWLSPWTQGGRWAFGLEFQGTMADNIGKSMEALDPAFSAMLGRHGVSSGMWDELRRAPIEDEAARAYMTPDAILKIDGLTPSRKQYLADRVLEIIQAETEFAVPTGSLRGQVAFLGSSQAGTASGELLRSVNMLKSFPTTVGYMHARRAIAIGMDDPANHGLSYAGKMGGIYMTRLMVTATLFGAMALQLSEISKGKDPRAMDTPEFWGAAAMKGGGLGILGDFLTAEKNAYGQSLETTLAGPVAGAGGDALSLTVGNVQQAIDPEKEMELGRDLSDTLRRYTPGGNIWYLRMFYERLFVDQVQLLVDPEASARMRRKTRRANSTTGQEFFWAPGEIAPDRAPELAAVAGDERR